MPNTGEMTWHQAMQINEMLVKAWFVWSKITPGPFPVLEGISLAEAIQATEIVAGIPPQVSITGVATYIATVNIERIPDLHAAVVAVNALDRIQREHREKKGNPA